MPEFHEGDRVVVRGRFDFGKYKDPHGEVVSVYTDAKHLADVAVRFDEFPEYTLQFKATDVEREQDEAT